MEPSQGHLPAPLPDKVGRDVRMSRRAAGCRGRSACTRRGLGGGRASSVRESAIRVAILFFFLFERGNGKGGDVRRICSCGIRHAGCRMSRGSRSSSRAAVVFGLASRTGRYCGGGVRIEWVAGVERCAEDILGGRCIDR